MELKDAILVQVRQFGQDDEEKLDIVTVGEITDQSDGEIEIALDLKNPLRRTYIRIRASDLLAELEKTE